MRHPHAPLASVRAAVVAAALLASAAGCSLGDESAPTPVRLATVEETSFAPALGVDLTAFTRLPSGLHYRDVVVGQGAEARTGQQLVVEYTGWFATNGQRFDGGTYGPFTLGARQVIPGWDEGLVGMRVGGRRQLLIPPALAYGPSDYDRIPGNSVLVFTVGLTVIR